MTMITKSLLWLLTNIKWDDPSVVFLINGEPFWVYVNFKATAGQLPSDHVAGHP